MSIECSGSKFKKFSITMYTNFISEKSIWKCHLQNVIHFLQASFCQLPPSQLKNQTFWWRSCLPLSWKTKHSDGVTRPGCYDFASDEILYAWDSESNLFDCLYLLMNSSAQCFSSKVQRAATTLDIPMELIVNATFPNSWKKILVFWFKFHWNQIIGVQLTMTQHLSR